jgi:fumarate reductase subunit C
MTVRLYFLQRMTAALMAPLVAGHLIVIFYATSKGLSAADVLARTRGSAAWALYYGAFVLLAAIHAAIGVRAVAAEWTPLRDRGLDALMWSFGLVLLLLGLRAVVAVVVP